eukprot:3694685-Alexandrium_andersonii.AAC.1
MATVNTAPPRELPEQLAPCPGLREPVALGLSLEVQGVVRIRPHAEVNRKLCDPPLPRTRLCPASSAPGGAS